MFLPIRVVLTSLSLAVAPVRLSWMREWIACCVCTGLRRWRSPPVMAVTVRRPWHGLEPVFLDRSAIFRTSAESAVFDTRQRVSHFVEQGSSSLRLSQLLVPQLAAGTLVAGVVRDPIAWLSDAAGRSLEPR